MWSNTVVMDDGSTAYFDFEGNYLYSTPAPGAPGQGAVSLPDTSILGDFRNQLTAGLGSKIREAFGGSPNGAPNQPAPGSPAAAGAAQSAQLTKVLMLAAGAVLVVLIVKKLA